MPCFSLKMNETYYLLIISVNRQWLLYYVRGENVFFPRDFFFSTYNSRSKLIFNQGDKTVLLVQLKESVVQIYKKNETSKRAISFGHEV